VKKSSWYLLIGTLLVTIGMYTLMGWGHKSVKRYITQPTTTRTTTNTDAVYSLNTFEKTLKRYPSVDVLALANDETNDNSHDLTYRDFSIIPGLKATTTIDSATGERAMGTAMTPQGVTIAGKYLVTSAYDHDERLNSVLYVQDLKTKRLIKTVVLQGRPHAGGITYDPNAKQLWVCGRRDNWAEVFAISLKTLESYQLSKNKPITYSQRALLGTISRASFITYHKQSLFVGFFNPRGAGNIQRYLLDKNGRIQGQSLVGRLSTQVSVLTNAVLRQDTLQKIQGLAFYDGYAILSQSFGPGRSKLYIFKEDLNKTIYHKSDALTTVTMPSHLEQISNHQGRLYTIYESSAYAYRKTSHDHIDRVVSLDLKDFITLIKKEVKS